MTAVGAHDGRGCGCFGDAGENPRQRRAEADFELARLDAVNTDWSVYAHHPNEYVRGLALLRLRSAARAPSEAELVRVAASLGDPTPLYSAECAALLASCEQGQGLDMERGLCVTRARRVADAADDVLAAAPPAAALRAIVTWLAEPTIAELTNDYGSGESTVNTRLRAASEQAPEALSAEVAARFPHAAPPARQRLLSAVLLAPLGAATAADVEVLAAGLDAKDEREALLAAAAVLRLTDKPGPTCAPIDREPRRRAFQRLSQELARGPTASRTALEGAGAIGPAAAPLIDVLLSRLPAPPQTASTSYRLAQIATILGKIGPRAARAADRLLASGTYLGGAEPERDEEAVLAILGALGAIGTPPARLIPFVLAHATSRSRFAAGVHALREAHAEPSDAEFSTLLQARDEYCNIPHHPRAFDGSWDACFAADSELALLKPSSGAVPTP